MEKNLIVTDEIRTKYNLPSDAIFDGSVDIISENMDDVKLLKNAHALSQLKIFGLGDVAYNNLASLIPNIWDVFKLNNDMLEKLELSFGVAKTKSLFSGIQAIKTDGIKIETIIDFLCIDGLGETTRKQLGNYYSNIAYDFSGLESAIIEKVTSNDIKSFIQSKIDHFENVLNIKVVYNQMDKKSGLKYILTGKPSVFGYSKKAEFIEQHLSSDIEVKNMSEADILVTDDLGSTSSKMKQAQKYGVKIVTYGDEMFK